ncbi:DNA helicase RecQ [Aquimarina intermedia]|uniref:DNA helicase RecQ n=1 Tax=Aquimarina intermedia TaxID=350814 RepID=A0A5S5C9L0_9FLAO|nr:DNA helicase RecQ [Aquimarina intermedia]TYP75182.1 ATP-dependent DNA helicase RecQ [Aquimarina intermedia]
MPELKKIKETLKEYFGYESFRPLQEKIISSVFKGEDNLVIMPTGGGKSICFQLPALLLPNITIVISPLIALMKDQVDGLVANGIPAVYLNSSQTESEQTLIFKQLKEKTLKLLYVAPESLSFLQEELSSIPISLIAIDEAHCISSWGHDFRPAYKQLGYLKNKYAGVPIIALTATADKATRADICNQLNIPHATQHLASFDRQNLALEVRPANKRIDQIVEFIDLHSDSSGIVYCLSRKTTEELAGKLEANGFKAAAYHAGMSHEQRSKVQEDFVNDTLPIVCATIAFGMGIDKSNVRWVIHYNLPKNLESYYQEIGRAGRDGLPSSTLLFHSYADIIQLQKFNTTSGNKEVQEAKLERMKQYAEALTCRRKILLSYFGELIEEDCGNCDVCKNPPDFIDGTLLAQKALSAVARLKESEPISTVIDVIRGAKNAVVLDRNYQQLTVYGIAKEISWLDWQYYFIQLMNLGYIEIAFHQKNRLKLTALSKKVLFEKEQVQLANLASIKEKEQYNTSATKLKDATSLFERLRSLRLSLAKKAAIPAYQIFNDATLKEMEQVRPTTDAEFMQINGVGRQKMQDYGYDFIKEIRAFTVKKKPKKKKKSNTLGETLAAYREGLTIPEMAQERKLTESTILSHLLKLSEAGETIRYRSLVDSADFEAVKKAQTELNNPDTLKAFYEYFDEAIPYNVIKVALAALKQDDIQ